MIRHRWQAAGRLPVIFSKSICSATDPKCSAFHARAVRAALCIQLPDRQAAS